MIIICNCTNFFSLLCEDILEKLRMDVKPKDTTEEVVKKLVKDKSCVECNYEASSRIDFGVHKVPLHCENVLCMSNLVTCEECCANKGSGLEIHENECDESSYKANVRKDVDVHKEHLHLVCYDRSDQSENVHCQGIECNVCSYEVDGKDDLRVHGEFDHEGLASINYPSWSQQDYYDYETADQKPFDKGDLDKEVKVQVILDNELLKTAEKGDGPCCCKVFPSARSSENVKNVRNFLQVSLSSKFMQDLSMVNYQKVANFVRKFSEVNVRFIQKYFIQKENCKIK